MSDPDPRTGFDHQDDRPGGAAGRVRGLTPPPVSVRRLTFAERILISTWFLPAVFVAVAMVASYASLAADRAVTVRASWLPGATPGSAETLAATVATGMLTFTAVVFSTTLVAIQLAGGQYSPRVVRLFVRSTLTHVTLGVFLATFVVALNTLVEIRDGDFVRIPQLTLILLYVMVIATVVTFIVFCHGIVRLLRVQYLMASITSQGREAITRFVPDEARYRWVPAPVPDPAAPLVRNGARVGVVMAVDLGRLMALVPGEGGWVELLVQPGEYLGEGTPVARLHHHGGPVREADQEAVRAAFLLGGERTLIQDPGFALRQLADIACRALSTAVNDPTTAVQAVDRISDLLATLAARPDPSGVYIDDAERVRVTVPEPGFSRLATLGLTEAAVFGSGSPQVVRRLLAAHAVLEGLTDGDRRETVRGLRSGLLAQAATHLPEAGRAVALTPDRMGLG